MWGYCGTNKTRFAISSHCQRCCRRVACRLLASSRHHRWQNSISSVHIQCNGSRTKNPMSLSWPPKRERERETPETHAAPATTTSGGPPNTQTQNREKVEFARRRRCTLRFVQDFQQSTHIRVNFRFPPGLTHQHLWRISSINPATMTAPDIDNDDVCVVYYGLVGSDFVAQDVIE